MGIVAKKLNPIYARLDRLLSRGERILQPAIAKWLDFTLKQIRKDLTHKFAKDQALDITTELTHWEVIEGNGIRTIKPAVLTVMGNGAQEAYKITELAGTFDVLNVQAIKTADKICAKLVKDVTDETKKGIKIFIRDGIKEGKSMPKIARELRPIVGLNERQVGATINYRAWLGEHRPELSAGEVDKRVGVYERKLHRKRMDMIARTETAKAQSEGYLLGMEDAKVEEVTWLAAPGCCEECAAMNGKKFSLDEASEMLPLHPDCRCAWAPVVK